MANHRSKIQENVDSHWLEEELSNCELADERLKKRLKKVCVQLWNGLGKSIPYACEDWANTKAAYRFFDNNRIDEGQILSSHFESTRTRFLETECPVLILQDTTEFSYEGDDSSEIGLTRIIPQRKDIMGRVKHHKMRGVLMHSSLAVTIAGLPLGLTSVKFWTRKNFKGCNELKRHVNPTRLPIEEKESYRWIENLRQSMALLENSQRCIHVGDRENDIYEFFHEANEIGAKFLVRTCVDRLAGDGRYTIENAMDEANVKGLYCIELRDKKGKQFTVQLSIKYQKIRVLPPIGKNKKYDKLNLTVIHAKEIKTPKGREPIFWKLITNLPVNSKRDAVEKLNWYAMRWKIETFHKILKSGCKAEDAKLRTTQRLANLIAVFCILSWRIFWTTMINRTFPFSSAQVAFTELEINILNRMVKSKERLSKLTLSDYLIKLARLGGYLARNSDPPPGNIVIWRGLRRLMDITLGFQMPSENCG